MEIRQVTFTLTGITPYSQSNFYNSTKEPKESHDKFEKRCWREKIHVNGDGGVVVPAMSLKYSIDEAIRRQQVPVPNGKGKFYTTLFQAGVQISEDIDLGIKADKVDSITLWCDPKGKKGKSGGTRVQRIFPIIPKWSGQVVAVVFDEKIPEDVFESACEYAGIFVGLGRFRPENQGQNGRFKCSDYQWSKM